MRRPAPLLPVLATVLLLPACGTEHAGTGSTGRGAGTPSPGVRVTDPGVDGVRITSVAVPSPSPPPRRVLSVGADRPPADSGVSAASGSGRRRAPNRSS